MSDIVFDLAFWREVQFNERDAVFPTDVFPSINCRVQLLNLSRRGAKARNNPIAESLPLLFSFSAIVCFVFGVKEMPRAFTFDVGESASSAHDTVVLAVDIL